MNENFAGKKCRRKKSPPDSMSSDEVLHGEVSQIKCCQTVCGLTK